MKIKFRLLFYAIVLTIYIFLPGIVQQIFIYFDDYYFYILIGILFPLNIFLANLLLKKTFLVSSFTGLIVTAMQALIGFTISSMHFGFKGIRISIFLYSIISIIAWESFYQIKNYNNR